MLAPVIVFAYNRYYELVETMDCLAKNIDADKTDVYIFSNAARDEVEGDDEKVDKVRFILKDYSNCFKKYEIICREENKGPNENMIFGISSIIEKYGRVIVVEDDIVTAPLFLKFMNAALDKYENDKEIFSICAYNPLTSECQLKGDTFTFASFRSWGYALWKNRWDDFSMDEVVFPKMDLCKAHDEAIMYISDIQNDISCFPLDP